MSIHEFLQSNELLEIELRTLRAILTKPFCIITGASGTGKTQAATRLAKTFANGQTKQDPFYPGAQIPSGRLTYFVKDSDKLAVEFWNNENESESTKVTLPREIIKEWEECIVSNNFDENVSCRVIRGLVSQTSKFSNQLHSFETHLKAAAHASINEPKAPSSKTWKVIAVGADWTDNRNVLGFVNHLRVDEESELPTYQSTPILDLLLRARCDSKNPYFLILDEMNLSHVERYFSDFLSVMEQKNGHFDLHSEGPADDEEFTLPTSGDNPTGVPRKLPYPQNLFVIGTVNIDETTYMFSPKVLDRANVIEFKVKRDDLGAFLEKPGAYPETQPAASGVAKGFLELAKKTRAHGLDPLPDSVREPMSKHLLTLFDLLQNERFEFAYRTAKEITLYLQVSRELSEDQEPWDTGGWQADLDTQILQKILPKLHGSIGRIAPLICALSHYCETGKTAGTPNLRDLLKKPFEKEKATFPRSSQKLREMARTLSVEQFVSFIS